VASCRGTESRYALANEPVAYCGPGAHRALAGCGIRHDLGDNGHARRGDLVRRISRPGWWWLGEGAVAAVWSAIVIFLLAWWATGAELFGSATLETPWPLIIMASLAALIVAGSIAVARRQESSAIRTRIVFGAISFVVIGVVLALEVANLISIGNGPGHLP